MPLQVNQQSDIRQDSGVEFKFTFVDLFSGIGGFHLGLSSTGGRCSMACDIDTRANESYRVNFGMIPKGDVRELSSECIPHFDVLCAGFPCQSFSNIGPNGGLKDPRGALIYQVFRILEDKQPKAFILENVKGLANHDKGKTLSYIVSRLNKAGYTVHYDILEAKDFDLPQIRKRLFIVGTHKDFGASFKFPEPLTPTLKLSDVLNGKTERDYAYTIRVGGRRSGINNRFNWDCYIVEDEPRYITVEECLQLQGFPRDFFLAGNTDQKLKQVGNSVPTTIVGHIGRRLIKTGIFD